MKNGKLTYGGLLFLGDNTEILNHISDFRVDYLEIPATSYADAEPRYTFRIQEQENIWEYYFALFQRLRIYADNPLYIGDLGGGYEGSKQLDALREALINMLAHCDYFSLMKPRIRVFTNRIEFENPGALPRPIEELMKTDVSVPRNPVLAKLFRIAKFCESAGYGFDRMLVWKKETHRDVFFETSIDRTKVIFMLKDGKLDIPESGVANKSGMKSGMKNTRQLMLSLIQEDNTISLSGIAEILKISRSAVQKHIDHLKKENLIRREGADKGGRWIIIES